jgi:hypothetical protein
VVVSISAEETGTFAPLVLGSRFERQLDRYLTATCFRPLQCETVIIAVQRLQSFDRVRKTNPISTVFVRRNGAGRARS